MSKCSCSFILKLVKQIEKYDNLKFIKYIFILLNKFGNKIL